MGHRRVISGSVRVGNRLSGIVWLSRPSTLSIIFTILGVTALSLALTLAGIPVIWMVWYRIQPDTSNQLAAILRRPISTLPQVSQPKPLYQPPLDTKLPQVHQITVSAIGVKTKIIEASSERYEEAFKQGVWRVPDFGDPYNREKPLILAAHRFGYLAWSNQYRKLHSFFNLPKVKKGDKVEIIWNQRKYVYEVYAEGEGEEITDYQADLILYTCKFLESPVRIFKYARLVEP